MSIKIAGQFKLQLNSDLAFSRVLWVLFQSRVLFVN